MPPPFFAPVKRAHYYGTPSKCDTFPNWHMVSSTGPGKIAADRTPMGSHINWTELEQRGLITPSPGREEAVRATIEHTAAKKAAQAAIRSNAKRS